MKRLKQPTAPTSFEPSLNEILEAIKSSTATNVPELSPNAQRPTLAPPPSFLYPLPSTFSSCILCSLVSAAVSRGIKALFAEFVNDPESRLRIRASRGFCREHTRAVHSLGDALGTSIIFADLADQTLERWNRGTAAITTGNRLVGRSRPAPCPACELEIEADTRYAGALAAGLSDESVWSALTAGAYLCVSHVEKTASKARREHGERLIKMEAKKLEALIGELNEVIRKHDYRFRNEEWGAERDSWLRALNRLVS